MVTVRRVYILLVCAISLNLAAWAAINLAWNLLASPGSVPRDDIAFQLALILIAFPFYLAHWTWAQRLARQDAGERSATLRWVYLYGLQAAFLAPILGSVWSFIDALLRLIFNTPAGMLGTSEPAPEALIRSLAALLPLALLWFYHHRIATGQPGGDTGSAAVVRRLYIYVFSAVGVLVTARGFIDLLRLLLIHLQGSLISPGVGSTGFTAAVAYAVVGLGTWVFFWGQAQRLFYGPLEEERASALRKFYLYVLVFIGVLGTVTYLAILLSGLLYRLLGLPALGSLSGPLPPLIALAVVWAYHARALQQDAALAAEAPRQAELRRLYLYLVAGTGLAALLVGLGGEISVLIRSLAEGQADEVLKAQLAWFSSALVVGLPVWLLAWRAAQAGAVAPAPEGVEERRSVVRKIYLYFYLFAATIAVLSSAVFIVYRLLGLLLDAKGGNDLVTGLAHASAYLLMGVAVWLYHGACLRQDGRLNRQDQAGRFAALRLLVIDPAGGFGRALLAELQRELPEIPVRLAEFGEGADFQAQLQDSDLLIGPWTMAVEAAGGEAELPAGFAQAVAASPRRKLLLPIYREGWDWAGVERWPEAALVQQAVHAVRQAAEGEPVRPSRPLGWGAIIGIILAALIVLMMVAIPLISLLAGG